MSVMLKEKNEVAEIEAGLRYWALQEGKIRDAVLGSAIYKQKYDWAVKVGSKDVGDGVVHEVVARMIWYLWIGNKTAHALQYREEPCFWDGKTKKEIDESEDVVVHKVELEPLAEECGHLNYNIFTNDGHYFVAKEWKELWDAILEVLKQYRKKY